jgi:hypothetical protein
MASKVKFLLQLGRWLGLVSCSPPHPSSKWKALLEEPRLSVDFSLNAGFLFGVEILGRSLNQA